jgi:hypothetical protein
MYEICRKNIYFLARRDDKKMYKTHKVFTAALEHLFWI